MAAARTRGAGALQTWCLLFSSGAGAPPPARAIADTSPRIHSPRLGVAAGAFPLAAGPHPRRVSSLMPRLGFTVLGSAWPQALLSLSLSPRLQLSVHVRHQINELRVGLGAGLCPFQHDR